ncbi:MAG TPA: DEAD/DEAH box helicase [Aquifex aeolicus]|nr:DEAD/DEAH box helicase [Aquifex aeolicus]
MFSLLKEEIRKNLEEIGFKKPTPIQEKTIPIALKGRDCLIQAKTGTGKTGAFGLPILNNIRQEEKALILAPTRELAIQIRDNLRSFAKNLNLKIYAFYGGTKLQNNLKLLRNKEVNVVIGTPGRVKDLINREVLKLDNVMYFVLDEVDVMLDMNFKEDIDFIYSKTPKEKQVFFVSATFPSKVVELSRRYTNNPEFIKIGAKELEPKIEEKTLKVFSIEEKLELLEELLVNFKKVIVFVNRKRDARFLNDYLRKKRISGEAIHGDLPQRKREEILKKFRAGTVKVLVATDVASRGLDIREVEAVINFHLPEDLKIYLHRIGRTGRMGREGVAVNLVSPEERKNLERIKRLRRYKQR